RAQLNGDLEHLAGRTTKTQQVDQQDQMARRGDRDELGQSLHDPQQGGLQILGQHRTAPPVQACPATAGSAPSRGQLEPVRSQLSPVESQFSPVGSQLNPVESCSIPLNPVESRQMPWLSLARSGKPPFLSKLARICRSVRG